MNVKPFYFLHDPDKMQRAMPAMAQALDNIRASGAEGASLIAFAEDAKIGFQSAHLGPYTAGNCMWGRSYISTGDPYKGRYARVQYNQDSTLSIEHILVHELTHAAQNIIHDILETRERSNILSRLTLMICAEAGAEVMAARVLYDMAAQGHTTPLEKAQKPALGNDGQHMLFRLYAQTYAQQKDQGQSPDEAKQAASLAMFNAAFANTHMVSAYADQLCRAYIRTICNLGIYGSRTHYDVPERHVSRFASLASDKPLFGQWTYDGDLASSGIVLPQTLHDLFPANARMRQFCDYLDFVRTIWVEDREADELSTEKRAELKQESNPFIDLDLFKLYRAIKDNDESHPYSYRRVLNIAERVAGIDEQYEMAKSFQKVAEQDTLKLKRHEATANNTPPFPDIGHSKSSRRRGRRP